MSDPSEDDPISTKPAIGTGGEEDDGQPASLPASTVTEGGSGGNEERAGHTRKKDASHDELVLPFSLKPLPTRTGGNTDVTNSAQPITMGVGTETPEKMEERKRAKEKLMAGLPTLDSYEGPTSDLSPLMKPSKSADKDAPVRQDAPQQGDLSGALTKLEFAAADANNQKMERLRFVVAGILEQDMAGKSLHDIFYLLLGKYDSCGPSQAETNRTFAATIFKEALLCARFNKKQIEALNQFCKTGLKDEKSLKEEMNYRGMLLDQVTNEDTSRRLAGKFTYEELGRSPQSIKTPTQLLHCLMSKKIISADRSSESIQLLEDKLEELNGSQTLAAEIGATGGGTAENVVEGNRNNEPVQQTSLKPSQKMCIATGCLTLLALIAACVGLSIHFGLLSTRSRSQLTTVYRNTTILVATEPLNVAYTAGIYFRLRIGGLTNIEICTLDCTNTPPPTRSLPLEISERSDETDQKRLVTFTGETNDLNYASVYLLSGSSLEFSTETIVGPIQLIIFNNLAECNQFFSNDPPNSSYRTFALNETNGYSVNFTVPPDERGSYYCAAWVVQSNQSTVTFQYSIRGSQIVYYIDQDNARCVNPLSFPSQCPPDSSQYDHCYNFLFELSFRDRLMCVLFSQTSVDDEATANIETFSTFRNAPFSFLIGILIFSVLLLAALFLTLFIWRCVRNRVVT